MDKNALVTAFAENDDEKIIMSHILDLAQRSWSKSVVESGNFLSPAQQMRAEQMLSKSGFGDFFFFGGYEGAERTCPVFYTDYCGEDMIKQSPQLAEITFIKAELDRFNRNADISHRDVLGSLMGLGIQRECVGDISIEDGYVAIAVKESISPFITESLLKIGRYPVSVTKLPYINIERKDDSEELFTTVASLRLDAVAASLFNTSRSVTSDAITQGLITVNGFVAKKTDAPISAGDRLAWRGKGRAELSEADGISKKGRIRLYYKRWR